MLRFISHPHHLMHKAAGWMLREVGKQDEKTLLKFLEKFSTQMPSVMRSYAKEKLNWEAEKNIDDMCFVSQKHTIFSTQRLNVLLKEIKNRYKLKDIEHFSNHSLRKCFGRKVVEMAGENSEMALIKLSELFQHSSVNVTRRYLGLRQEELLNTYDCLDF